DFLNTFYRGGYISHDKIDAGKNHLLPKNHVGIYTGMSAAYTWRNKNDTVRWDFTVAFRDRQAIHGLFTDDAYRLVFDGNEPYAGTTLDLGGTHFTAIHWQQLQLEAKYFYPDGRSEIAFGFSLMNGTSMSEVSIDRGTLFTPTTGTSLDLGLTGSYYASDTASKKYFTNNGFGSCFNFRFSTFLGNPDGRYRHQLSFSVQDLGYMHWNSRSIVYTVDTTMHYTGADVSGAIINHEQVTGFPSADSIFGSKKVAQVITFLPIGIRARYVLLTPTPFWGGVEAKFWSNGDALPMVTIFAGWRNAKNNFNVVSGVSGGGYGKISVPLMLAWSPCRNFRIMAGCDNVAGEIAPKKTHAQGLFTNLSFAF
ncbi:MAG TPA: DUF5723 family protein, partial [Bacteroidia bacterium]|nr:DUF5723 family protein [Bacteroidia bacterium]